MKIKAAGCSETAAIRTEPLMMRDKSAGFVYEAAGEHNNAIKWRWCRLVKAAMHMQSRRIDYIIILWKKVLIYVAGLKKLLEADCSELREHGDGSDAE